MIKKYKIHGMHCASCALNIEWSLEDIGVNKCKCTYASSELEIDYDHNMLDEVEIIKTVEKTGYTISPK